MNNLCKECKHYRDGGVCVSSKNRKGYTSALDSSRSCWEAPDPLDGNDSVFSQQAPKPAKEGAEVPTKKCKVCGKVLPLSEFPFHPKSKDGHTATCSYCHAESVRAGLGSSEKVAAKRRKKELEKVAKEHEQKPIAVPEPAEIVEVPEAPAPEYDAVKLLDYPDNLILIEANRRKLPVDLDIYDTSDLFAELMRRPYSRGVVVEEVLKHISDEDLRAEIISRGLMKKETVHTLSEEQQLCLRETYGNLVSNLVDEELDGGDQKKINRLLGGISILQGVAGLLNFKIK